MFQTTNQNMNWNMDWMIDCCKKDTKFFFKHFIRYLDKRSEFHQHFNLRLKPYPLVSLTGNPQPTRLRQLGQLPRGADREALHVGAAQSKASRRVRQGDL